MHPKMLLLGLCTLELLCLSAQAIFESLCIIYYIICHYVIALPLDMGLFSSLCCLVQMWLPLFVLNVCIILFPRLLITPLWDCIGTGFQMHGVYFSVIHFDNFNLTVLQASFLSCSIVWTRTCGPLPPG